MSQTVVEIAEARPTRNRRELALTITGLTLLGLVGLWVVVQFFSDPEQFIEVLLIGLNLGALYALIALGYTLVYGIIELINFSHGDLFMLATVFSAFVLVAGFSATSPSLVAFALLLFVMVLSMAAAAGVNMAAERLAYRRLRRAPKLAPLITAVGLSFIYQGIAIQPWANGSAPRSWTSIIGNRTFSVGPIDVRWSTVIVIAITVPLLMLMTAIVQRTRAGKAMRATAQDQDAARLMGIDVDRTISLVFGMGGALAGAAGLLYVESIGTTRFDLGFQIGLVAFTAAVLGGIGNLNGAVLGGFLIGIIQGLNDGLGFGQKWSQTVVFTILIALMVFRPEGILGTTSTEKV